MKKNKILFSFFVFLLIHATGFAQFDFSLYNMLLKKYVHGNKVDYKSFLSEKELLFDIAAQMGKISPDSHPEQFQTEQQKLAYWINAYNVFILKIILEKYPVDSIKDINFLGFTVWLNKNLIGGKKISYKSLEDDIIRGRFNDPRIHFAINCASTSCPPLLNEAFLPEKLEEQLEKTTINFINDTANVYINNENNKIYLSAIFNWYEDDFTSWLKKNRNIDEPVIIDYIKIYHVAASKIKWHKYDIEYFEYDWDLNDYIDNTN